MLFWLGGLGLVAGILTTVAGLGGGMLLVLALSLLCGPHAALAMTAPALLIGNAHRLFLFRAKLDRAIGARYVAGALPGSIAGGFATVLLPGLLLKFLMIGMVGLALLRARGWIRLSIPALWILPAGFGIGALAATAGGAGMLVAPLFMAAGLKGESYVATTSLAALSMHVGRLLAYGAGGLYTRELGFQALLLALFILAGNAIGVRVKRRLREKTSEQVEFGALLGCALLALSGIGK